MSNAKPEMLFSIASTLMQEIIRQQRGMQRLDEVLAAAVRAERTLKSTPGQIKGLEKRLDELKGLVREAQEKLKTAGDEWTSKTEGAKTAHQDFIVESTKRERQLNKKYKTQKADLEGAQQTKRDEFSKECAVIKNDLTSFRKEREKAQNELNKLQMELSHIMGGFSKKK